MSILSPYRSSEDIDDLMETYTRMNLRNCPDICRFGVYRYGAPWGFERVNRFRMADEIPDAESVDCDDLGPARAAELRLKGERNARAVSEWVPELNMWHIVVEREDGRREDPSLALHPAAGSLMQEVYIDPDHETFAIDYWDGVSEESETLLLDPGDPDLDGVEIGGVWSVAPRLLTALLPVGAQVMQAAFPGVYDVAREVAFGGARIPTRSALYQVMRPEPFRSMPRASRDHRRQVEPGDVTREQAMPSVREHRLENVRSAWCADIKDPVQRMLLCGISR